MAIKGGKVGQRNRLTRPISFFSIVHKQPILGSMCLLGLMLALLLPLLASKPVQKDNSVVLFPDITLTPALEALLTQSVEATAEIHQPPDSNDSASPNSTTTPKTQNHSSAEVTINGQSITVPENGSIHKTIPSENGQTNVDISIQSRSSGQSQSNRGSSTRLQIFSESKGSTKFYNQTRGSP